MITDAQYAAWLEDSTAQRVTLYRAGVRSGGSDITRRFSNKAYLNASGSSPYLAIVAGGLRMTESISLRAEAGFSAGSIELYNYGRVYDSWLNDIWVNQPIEVLVGDIRWPEADFRTVFVGVIEDIDGTKARNRISLILVDKFKRLDAPITDEKMGGLAANPETMRPKLLGEVHNLTPKLKNGNTGEYEFNAGDSEDVIEARYEGKIRAITKNLSVGSFTVIGAAGAGALTCSAQGVKPGGTYTNRIVPLIKYLVTECGNALTRFTTADLDLANLAAFDSAHSQAVGLYVPDRMKVLEACHRLASSVGGQLVPSRLGLLRILSIAFPTSSTTELRPARRKAGTLQLVGETEVVGAVKIGYCKNYTVQPNLQTTIPEDHKALYAEEWLSVSASDSTVIANYKLDAAVAQEDTELQDTGEAQAEATRRLGVFKVKRRTYRYEGTPIDMLLELGQDATLFGDEYEELVAGKPGVVTSLTPDWDNFHVIVEVTV